MAMLQLSIDFEFSSRTWWEHGGEELWQGIAEAFDGSSVVLEEELAESWLAQARRIQGWDDGPDYAPHPIAASPVQEDEEIL
jgi:hypothetical protein